MRRSHGKFWISLSRSEIVLKYTPTTRTSLGLVVKIGMAPYPISVTMRTRFITGWISWSHGEIFLKYPPSREHLLVSWWKVKKYPPTRTSRGLVVKLFFLNTHHKNISWSRGKHRNGSIPYLRDHENQIYHVMYLLVSWQNLFKIPPTTRTSLGLVVKS